MDFDKPAFLMNVLMPAGMTIAAVMALLRWLGAAARISPEAMIGLKPQIRPFETREEFLKARMEMDLEDFLDRASVTPSELKCGAVTPSSTVDLAASVMKFFESPAMGGAGSPAPDVILPKVGRYYRTKQLGELVCLKRTGSHPVIWYATRSSGVETPCWMSDLKVAYPMAGEFWESILCLGHMPIPKTIFYENEDCLSQMVKEKVECGCFVPSNFGKG